MVSIPSYFGVLKIAYIVAEVSCLRHTKPNLQDASTQIRA